MAISIHAPRAGCDFNGGEFIKAKFISIHAPRAGCDLLATTPTKTARHFNPRTPCGVRLPSRSSNCEACHISIHAPRAGCDWPTKCNQEQKKISIHAPRAGCDDADDLGVWRCSISIHAPRAGCDCIMAGLSTWYAVFQSTHPVRGATDSLRVGLSGSLYFNPRTPCGVRPWGASTTTIAEIFQSTHPVRTANLTVLPDQICARGTKKSLFSRKNAQKRK